MHCTCMLIQWKRSEHSRICPGSEVVLGAGKVYKDGFYSFGFMRLEKAVGLFSVGLHILARASIL